MRITMLRAIAVRIPRDTPYLGSLNPDIYVSDDGYFIRPGNKSIYSIHDQSLIVEVRLEDGTIGWGEAVAFYAPETLVVLSEKLVFPFVLGRSVEDVEAIYEDLYDAMRVRGFFGGFYHDLLAAIDIALWDAKGKVYSQPVGKLLGASRKKEIPAYISGLPGKTLQQRKEIALAWQDKGYQQFKFADAVASEGSEREMESLRETLGDEADIMVDLHWRYNAPEAVRKIKDLNQYRLWVAEAPCKPEDIEGLSQVAQKVDVPVAGGEELRTVHEYMPRLIAEGFGIIQPEMGRTGITSFIRIARLAEAFHCIIMPHASIGVGIFQAASLQVSSALSSVFCHEYQHSVFDRNLQFLNGDMHCLEGAFHIPTGPGLGVEPKASFLERYAISESKAEVSSR